MQKILIVGYGSMGQALAFGWRHGAIIDVYTPSSQTDSFVRHTFRSIAEIPTSIVYDHIVLAVKPMQVIDVLQSLKHIKTRYIHTVAAGVMYDDYMNHIPDDVVFVRLMPNLAVRIGEGVIGIFMKDSNKLSVCTTEVRELINMLGMPVFLKIEQDMHTITAFAGSAIAFVYRYMEAFKHAFTSNQFTNSTISQDLMNQIIVQNFYGSSALVSASSADSGLDYGVDFQKFRKAITSPNGTTHAGLAILQNHAIDQILLETLGATVKRGMEISDTFCQQQKNKKPPRNKKYNC